jgi:hypothetical protein
MVYGFVVNWWRKLKNIFRAPKNSTLWELKSLRKVAEKAI